MNRSPKKNRGKGLLQGNQKKQRTHDPDTVEEKSDLGFVSGDSPMHPVVNGTGSLSRGNSTKSRASEMGVDGLRSPIKAVVKKHYDHSIVLNYEDMTRQNLEDTDPNLTLELMRTMTEKPTSTKKKQKGSPQPCIPAKLFQDLNNSSQNEVFFVDIPLDNEMETTALSAADDLRNNEEYIIAGYSSLDRSFRRNQNSSFRHRRSPAPAQKWRYRSLRSNPCSPNSPKLSPLMTDMVDAPKVAPETTTPSFQQRFSPNIQSTPKRVSHGIPMEVDSYATTNESQQYTSSPDKLTFDLETSTVGELPSAIFGKAAEGNRISVSVLKAQLEQKFASTSTLNSKSDVNINYTGKTGGTSRAVGVKEIIKRFESGTISNPTSPPGGSPSRSKYSTLPGRSVVSMYNPTEAQLSMIRSDTLMSGGQFTGSEPSLYTEDKFTISNGPSDDLPTEPKYVHISCSASGYSRVNFKSPPKTEEGASEEGEDTDMGAKHSKSKLGKSGKTSPSKNTTKAPVDNEANSVIIDTSNVIIDCSENKENILVNGNSLKEKSESNGNSIKDSVNSAACDAKVSSEDQSTQNLKNEVLSESSPLNDSLSSKDGNYFLKIVESQTIQLQLCCSEAEKYTITEELPEDASGKIRVAVGKANLLISKKFEQFKKLCHRNLSQSADEPFKTTSEDLAGFWDMVDLQVDEVKSEFAVIEKMKENNWIEPEPKVLRVRRISSGSSQKGQTPESSKTHSTPTTTPGARSKTSKTKDGAKDRAKVREEARKRLQAAKRAMRNRLSSSEEVEIFLPESSAH